MEANDTGGELALCSCFLSEDDSGGGHLCASAFLLGHGFALLLGGFSLQVFGLLGGEVGQVGRDGFFGPEFGIQFGLVVFEPRTAFGG